MAHYKNGSETKKALYDSAQKLFYLKGYNATTIRDIVTDAGSKLGLFTYYFDSKEALAITIFKDFVNDIAFSLEEPLAPLYAKNDFLLIDMIEYRSYFKSINSGENITLFYNDISPLERFSEMTIALKDYFIQKLFDSELDAETNPLIRDKTYFDAVASLTSGMELQFFRDVIKGKINIDYEDAIDLFMTEYYRFLIRDKNLIQTNMRKSRKIAADLHFEIKDNFWVRLR